MVQTKEETYAKNKAYRERLKMETRAAREEFLIWAKNKWRKSTRKEKHFYIRNVTGHNYITWLLFCRGYDFTEMQKKGFPYSEQRVYGIIRAMYYLECESLGKPGSRHFLSSPLYYQSHPFCKRIIEKAKEKLYGDPTP